MPRRALLLIAGKARLRTELEAAPEPKELCLDRRRTGPATARPLRELHELCELCELRETSRAGQLGVAECHALVAACNSLEHRKKERHLGLRALAQAAVGEWMCLALPLQSRCLAVARGLACCLFARCTSKQSLI